MMLYFTTVARYNIFIILLLLLLLFFFYLNTHRLASEVVNRNRYEQNKCFWGIVTVFNGLASVIV
jgi:hypothetical protein